MPGPAPLAGAFERLASRLAMVSLQSAPTTSEASAIVSRNSSGPAPIGSQARYDSPASSIASRPRRQASQLIRWSPSQSASAESSGSCESCCAAISGSARSQSGEVDANDASAVP